MCIFYMLLKVISYDDLSVLSMSAVGFQKESFDRGMGGWGELYRIFWDFFGILQITIIVQWLRFSVHPGFYTTTLTKCIYLDISIIHDVHVYSWGTDVRDCSWLFAGCQNLTGTQQ